MKTSSHWPLFAMAAMFLSGAAAASGAAMSEAQRTYQSERAVCLSGQSNEDRATCLKEAGAALQEARRANLGTARDDQLAQNRTERCQAVPSADRADCVRRANGEGIMSGSVQQGGILRELTSPVTQP
jgi:hypothetical protein